MVVRVGGVCWHCDSLGVPDDECCAVDVSLVLVTS